MIFVFLTIEIFHIKIYKMNIINVLFLCIYDTHFTNTCKHNSCFSYDIAGNGSERSSTVTTFFIK